jgi:hypothetical protein
LFAGRSLDIILLDQAFLTDNRAGSTHRGCSASESPQPGGRWHIRLLGLLDFVRGVTTRFDITCFVYFFVPETAKACFVVAAVWLVPIVLPFLATGFGLRWLMAGMACLSLMHVIRGFRLLRRSSKQAATDIVAENGRKLSEV